MSTALVFAAALAASPAHAGDACASVTRENVVRCAIDASAAVRLERSNAAAAEGRRAAAKIWLPSNPVLLGSVARRAGTEGRSGSTNWYATLGQEIEIAGQRGARERAAEADVSARAADVTSATRRAAADALLAFFDGVAAREALRLAGRLESTSRLIARVTAERAASGVGSALDAEVADAASLRTVQERIAAERAVEAAGVRLAVLLGRDPLRDAPEVSGTLEPLAVDALATNASAKLVLQRPEVRALGLRQRAGEARADELRRLRVPNLTLSIFAQNDGYDERVYGAGIGLPIPLPSPIGRTRAGEIAEADALAHRSGREAELATRDFSGDLALAVGAYRSRRAEAEVYSKERAERAEKVLADVGREIEAGRLPVRDAVLAQQQLIDVVRGFVEARRALCAASVELALAGNLPLETIR